MKKNIMFIPEFVLSNINADKYRIIEALNSFFKKCDKLEELDVDKLIKESGLIGFSKKDLAYVAASTYVLLDRIKLDNLSKDFIEHINTMKSRFKTLEMKLQETLSDPNFSFIVLFSEVLTFYKFNTHNDENKELSFDFLNTYKVISDKDYLCFIMKKGYSDFYQTGEYDSFIASSLIKYDNNFIHDYVKVLISAI